MIAAVSGIHTDDAVDAFLAASRKPCAELDLTLGRSGSLLAASMLLALGEHEELRAFGTETKHAIWSTLRDRPSIDGSLGMAHGWTGYLYAALRWCAASGDALPSSLIERLHELASLKIVEGRGAYWPSWEAMTASWCNGSAGQVFLFALAHRLFGDAQWLQLAELAAWHAWDEPRANASLCCGTAGRAYALLNLYKQSGAKEWLSRARQLANDAARAAAPGVGGKQSDITHPPRARERARARARARIREVLRRHQLPEHERQDAAVHVVVDFDRRVDAHDDGDFVGRSGAAMNPQRGLLHRTQSAFDADDVERLRAVERQRLRARSFVELQRENAHADEVGAVNALEALGDDGADAEEARAFGGPIAGTAGAVFLSCDHDERRLRLHVTHRRVVDRHPFAGRIVHRHAAFDARHHQVLDAHVRERAAGHHLIVAAARAVAVEVFDRHAALDQVLAGRRRRLDRAGGADVIGRHRVAEDRQRTRVVKVGRAAGIHREVLKERRLLDVGRARVPLIEQSRRHRDLVPQRILVGKI